MPSVKKEVQMICGTLPLERAPEHTGADFTSSIALTMGKKEKKDPKDVAQKLAAKLQKNERLKRVTETIEVADPGFINIFLSERYLAKTLSRILEEGERFGKTDELKGKKIMV